MRATICADCRTLARTDVPCHEYLSAPAPAPGTHAAPVHTDIEPIYEGNVTITGPNTKGYYRLKWHEPDGTPGSRYLDMARIKAKDIDARISRAAGPKATTRLDVVLDEFFADGHSPYKKKTAYKAAQLDGLEHKLTRGLRGTPRSNSLWSSVQSASPLFSSSGPSKLDQRTCAASMPTDALPSCPSKPQNAHCRSHAASTLPGQALLRRLATVLSGAPTPSTAFGSRPTAISTSGARPGGNSASTMARAVA